MKKNNSINSSIGCKLLTSVLLHKNLPNHHKVKEATEKDILLNGCYIPYQYLKHLFAEHPEVMDAVAIMQDRKIN